MKNDAAPDGHLPDRELLLVEDVARFLGVAEPAVRKRIRLRQLGPWMRSGRRWAIRKSTFLKWLDGQEGR